MFVLQVVMVVVGVARNTKRHGHGFELGRTQEVTSHLEGEPRRWKSRRWKTSDSFIHLLVIISFIQDNNNTQAEEVERHSSIQLGCRRSVGGRSFR